MIVLSYSRHNLDFHLWVVTIETLFLSPENIVLIVLIQQHTLLIDFLVQCVLDLHVTPDSIFRLLSN